MLGMSFSEQIPIYHTCKCPKYKLDPCSLFSGTSAVQPFT